MVTVLGGGRPASQTGKIRPALDIADLLRTDPATGRGIVDLLAADRLIKSPQLYSTFLLWLLSELFEHLPEAGAPPPQPKLVFFFDIADLLRTDTPPALRQRVEQVVRLIRSKGVGVFFVTQNPTDLPDTVLSELGNRVQHALRAFTPAPESVKSAADTSAPTPTSTPPKSSRNSRSAKPWSASSTPTEPQQS